MNKFLVFVSIFIFSITAVEAQPALRPYVSVIGEADMEISPDLAIFHLEIISLDKDLIRSKKINDDSTIKTLATARSIGVLDDDVQTDSFVILPKYKQFAGSKSEEQFVGYEVKKTIYITLRDLKKLDNLLNGVVMSGVNKIAGVSFESTKIREFREQVRAMAIKNASEKARAYARQLGLKVGRALSVREEGADATDFGTGSGTGSGAGDNGYDSWSDPNGKIGNNLTFSIGKISIEDKIYVIFALDQ